MSLVARRLEILGFGSTHADTRHSRVLAIAEHLCPSLNGASSYRFARAIEAQGVDPARGFVTDEEEEDYEWLLDGANRAGSDRVQHWRSELGRLAEAGIRMVDVLDDDYPANLRMVHNRPPFLMVRGDLEFADVRAIAVVGTRDATPRGREAAFHISEQLAARQVTVVSGLARGIDTAAHEGSLAGGGRTIAVFGTGIEVTYPSENRGLADRISAHGACVSQFLPGMRGARWSFPARNLVTSGLSLGTVVVEAGETSGARLQAMAAIDHGKRVLLLSALVDQQPWAAEAASRPGVIVVDSVDRVVEAVDRELQSDVLVM